MRLPRILVLDGKEMSGVSLWRLVRPWTALHRAGLVEVDIAYVHLQQQDLYRYDVIVLAHAHHETLLKALRGAHLAGCAVWVDCDDDIANVPKHNFKEPSLTAKAKVFRQILAEADIVSFSTPKLAEVYGGEIKATPAVLPNSVYMDELKKEWNGGKNVLWRGNGSQLRDIWVNIKDFEKLGNAGFSFAWMGFPMPFIPPEDLVYLEWGPSHEYFNVLRRTQASFFWKPLEDNQFNNGKSNIAMLEGAMAGALTISNMTNPMWTPAIKATEAIERNDNWKQRRYADMLQFIENEYNARTVDIMRYEHLINALGLNSK